MNFDELIFLIFLMVNKYIFLSIISKTLFIIVDESTEIFFPYSVWMFNSILDTIVENLTKVNCKRST